MENPSLRKLTERLLSLPGSSRARLLVGQLPEHWPSAVPLIEDMRVVGSVSSVGKVRVILEARLSPEQVLEAYRRVLTSQGARILSSIAPDGIEDSSMNIANNTFRLPDGLLSVHAFRQTGENITDVRLYWTATPRRNDIQRASSSFNRVPVSQIPLFIPHLDAPYLEVVHSRATDARGQFVLFRATVAADASNVLEYFAQQLAGAGWRRITEAIGQADTCYTWRIPIPGRPNDAWGALWVLEWPGRDHQKVIMVRAEL